ncbi:MULTISPECIES: DUF262 domain-containing protein [Acinetobacter]|uniref:DUF262 domain-containing protein n=1 Tax=Acinetobacter indicus TaxID=756892 RepID=A0A6C0Y6N3_9GAMM|nr:MULTISPECIES: DUF262 domain-containing protein [Acinetobacter]QIC71917.1 DUF262 domain-containing protein [Acinetobacter indicus]QKQ71454.1 DUF262 domain-containing protein [Acinetobacter sp. 10FS3-1]
MAKVQISKEEELAREANRERVNSIIKPLDRPGYTCDFSMRNVRELIVALLKDESELDMIPDFQRGVVWSEEKQIYFVECMLRNLLPRSAFNLTFNMPYFYSPVKRRETDIPTKYQKLICVDGLQRFTAIENFVQGKFKVFDNQIGADDLRWTQFDLGRKTFTINVFEYDNTQDILNLYLNMNTGGIAHADTEIMRVREMLAEYQKS